MADEQEVSPTNAYKKLKARFSEVFGGTPEEHEQLQLGMLDILFGDHSPLQRKFGASAHPHLILLVLRRALGEETTGNEIADFFKLLAEMRAKGEFVEDVSICDVADVVDDAVDFLEDRKPSLS